MDETDCRQIENLLMGYTKIAAQRRPEAMNAELYATAYGEAERHGKRCERLMEEC